MNGLIRKGMEAQDTGRFKRNLFALEEFIC